MEYKLKRILGLLCLAYSAISLILLVSVTVIPTMARITNRTWRDNIISVGLIYIFGTLGAHLVRKEPKPNTIMNLYIFILLLSPIIVLQAISKTEQLTLRTELFPWLHVLWVAISLIIVCIPYLFGHNILKRLEARSSRSKSTPSKILHFVGMACSLMPSTIGFCFYLLGTSKDAVCYSVVLSYIAGAAWWFWWIHRYSKTSMVI